MKDENKSKMQLIAELENMRQRISKLEQQETERKQAEEALRTSENNLRTLFNAMTDVVFEMDYNGTYINIAPTSPELIVSPSKGLVGKTLHEIFPRSKANEFLQFIRKCLDENKINTIEYPLTINDRLFWFEGRATPKTSSSVLYIARDITERKRAEEALRESESKLLMAQYIAKMGDFTWNIQTGKMSWSAGMYQLLKYDTDEMMDYDKVKKNIHHPDDLENVTKWIRNSIAAGTEELVPNEYRLICKDGEIITVQTNGKIEYEAGKAVKLFGTCLNITERKRAEAEKNKLEKQLRRSQKLETIGTLTGGIAHDFNNILTPIMGYADIALSELPPSSPLANDLEQILAGAHRAKELVEQILSEFK